MPVKGSGKAGLEALIKKLKASADGRAAYETAKKLVAAEAITQVQLGFRESRDPYGKPWAPLTSRPGKPLLNTARLRNSFTYDLMPNAIRIGTNFPFASVHQRGMVITPREAKRLRFFLPGAGQARVRADRRGANVVFAKKVVIPQRLMVPTRERGPGPIWRPALDKAWRRGLAKFFGKVK